MSALFNFQSLLSVILLLICTCAYLRSMFPTFIDRNKTGGRVKSVMIRSSSGLVFIASSYSAVFCISCEELPTLINSLLSSASASIKDKKSSSDCRMMGTFWKLARIGERKSPYVAVCCLFMAATVLFFT